MSKLDAFLWLSVMCCSEVSRSSHPQTASEFLQKDIDKFKACQTNESIKKIHYGEKKESMEHRETNLNASYYN